MLIVVAGGYWIYGTLINIFDGGDCRDTMVITREDILRGAQHNYTGSWDRVTLEGLKSRWRALMQ